MKQLKMVRFFDVPVECPPLPEGVCVSRFASEADVHAWCECLRGGALIEGRSDADAFRQEILERPGIVPGRDVFFLDCRGEHIGTATGFLFPGTDIGDLHQVGIRADHRGKGLAKHLCAAVLLSLRERGARFVSLTTDEFRRPAIRAYVAAGFRPVDWAPDMEGRWLAVMDDLGIDTLPLLRDDGTFLRTLRRTSGA